MCLVYPPKFCIAIIVFDFSWDNCKTQEKFETMVMQNLGGLTRCIMVYVKRANLFLFQKKLNLLHMP